jgi:hypothetical protein
MSWSKRVISSSSTVSLRAVSSRSIVFCASTVEAIIDLRGPAPVTDAGQFRQCANLGRSSVPLERRRHGGLAARRAGGQHRVVEVQGRLVSERDGRGQQGAKELQSIRRRDGRRSPNR